MKKILLVLTIGLLMFLVSCSDQRKVRLSGYDLDELNTCMVAILDNDDETVCSNEEADSLVREYAEYFLDRFDDETIYINKMFSYNVSNDAAFISVTYSDINDEQDLEYEDYQRIFEEMTYDLRKLSDVFVTLYVRFVFDNQLGFTFFSVSNTPENVDDSENRVFSMTTQDQLVEEMFDYAFADYLDLLDDEAYSTVSLQLMAHDYTVIVDIDIEAKTYNLMITEKPFGHQMTEQDIENKIIVMLEDYDYLT